MTADPGALLPVALHAADAARELMLTGPQTITEKSDRDLVSDVDLAIERAIRAYLRQATPDIGFLGEEEGQSGDSASGWLWTLDPIDGTSNYVTLPSGVVNGPTIGFVARGVGLSAALGLIGVAGAVIALLGPRLGSRA